jgi:hypothetical protein
MELTALAGGTNKPPAPPPPDRRDWKAVPTVYGGIEFRSRLEAKWAAAFDQLKWPWTYEPFDGNRYTPDFLLPEFTDRPALVEIKPAVTEAQYRAPIAKMTNGLAGHWDGDLLILGADPFPACWEYKPGLPAAYDDDAAKAGGFSLSREAQLQRR